MQNTSVTSIRPDFLDGVNAPAVNTKMVQDFAKPTRTFWKTQKAKVLRNQLKPNGTSENAGNVTKSSIAIWRDVYAPEESIIKAKSGKY